MEETIRYYHFCQHPETLSMDNLKSRGLYLSHDENNWSSPHLKDVVSYLVTLKPDVKLKKIYSECDFEQLDRQDLILQYMNEGYDGIEHRFGLKEDEAFSKGGGYEEFEFVEPPAPRPLGDSSADQIFLFKATDSVVSIEVSRPSTFQTASEYIEVVLERSTLPSFEDQQIADLRESLGFKLLLRKFSPKMPSMGCFYQYDQSKIYLRYIPVTLNEKKASDLHEFDGLLNILDELGRLVTSTQPHRP